MKTALSTLAAALALAFSTAALAAPGAPAATQWDQSQEHLVRQFSQGFGFAIDEAHPFLVARAAQLRHVKLPKHSR